MAVLPCQLSSDPVPVTFVTPEKTEHRAAVHCGRTWDDQSWVHMYVQGAAHAHCVRLRVESFLWSHSTQTPATTERREVWFWKHPIAVGDTAYALRFADARELRVFVHSL
jgi:hypothetical protein